MNSKNLSLEEYSQVLNYYKVSKPNNIYKLKKNANYIMLHKMCKTNQKMMRYRKILNVLQKKNIKSHNKKNLKYGTLKMKISYYKHNNTRVRSPVYYLCI